MPSPSRFLGLFLPLVLVCAVITPGGAAEKNLISPLANTDENYAALRNISLAETFSVSDLTIKRDIGVFQLVSGRVTLAKPVLGRTPLAVFSGQGEFVFEPALSWEQRNLLIHTGSSTVRETFDGLVLWFTDDTAAEILAGSQPAPLDAGAQTLLKRLQSRLRTRRERPQYTLEALLTGEDMDNVEADVLTELHNPEHAGSFQAYIFGKKYSDLRFFVRPRGAMPQLISNEEVALINYDPAGSEGGVWYLAHRSEEYADGKAAPHTFPIDAKHYAIETTIQGNKHLDARCKVTFTATVAGERVVKFGLLPSLRVRSVRLGGTKSRSYKSL